jgi:hypothetical protein
VAGDQPIEEMPHARGDAGGFRELLEVVPHMPGSDFVQLPATVFLDPDEEQLKGVHIGAPRVLVADRAEEEFLRRKDRVGTGAVDDIRQLLGDGRGKIPHRRGESGGVLISPARPSAGNRWLKGE